jgi:hypothetical protein
MHALLLLLLLLAGGLLQAAKQDGAADALLARGVWAAAPDGRDDTPLHVAAR